MTQRYEELVRVVEFTDAPLPRNPAGKLLKNALRGKGAVPFDTSPIG